MAWKKGESGNPNGRPKSDRTIEDLAKVHTPAAIHALVLALKSPRERVPAAIALLDRAWGRPKQLIAGDRDMPLIVDFRWAGGETIAPTIEDKTVPAIDAEWTENDA